MSSLYQVFTVYSILELCSVSLGLLIKGFVSIPGLLSVKLVCIFCWIHVENKYKNFTSVHCYFYHNL